MRSSVALKQLQQTGAQSMRLGQLGHAELCFKEILTLQPRNAFAAHAMALIASRQERHAEAAEWIERAVSNEPWNADFRYNQGLLLQKVGHVDAASEAYEQALKLAPNHGAATINLAALKMSQGQIVAAEALCRKALRLQPNSAASLSNLGCALQAMGRLTEAHEALRRAVELDSHFVVAYDNLLQGLNYDPRSTQAELLSAHQEYQTRYCPSAPSPPRMHSNSRDATRRIKLGYVSGDFRRHSVTHFLEPLLSHHDKQRVEVFAYSNSAHEDEVTDRYKALVDHWRPCARLSDAELVELIRADQIDILVDLSGHTDKNRLTVFAQKPAPIACTWLGYGYTTGLTSIDYYLTDDTTVPPGAEAWFSETPWRLSTPSYAYRPASGMGEISPLPAQASGIISFGTLTRAIRINELTIQTWAAILHAIPMSRLIVNSRDFQEAAMCQQLTARFGGHGIDPSRLQIGYQSPPWDSLRAFDVSLDCFPHNSGTTLVESLYMGVPFVTLCGRPSMGRLGASILTAAGHPEWIAYSESQYVDICVQLAGDLPKLAATRAQLRDQLAASAIMDERAFAARVEQAYRSMFEHWCRNASCRGTSS